MRSLFPIVDMSEASTDGTAEPMAFGYGSPIILITELLREIVLTIVKDIRHRKNIIARHNLFAVYTYLCAEFAFGLRPRNRPQLPICYGTGAALINDKRSVKSHEQRLLPFPKLLFSLVLDLRSSFDELKYQIAKSFLYPPAMLYELDNTFFLVDDKKGLIKDFTLKEMNAILQDIGISLGLPPNFPRHYTRNYLYHLGLANDVIDVWFGHQHAGREMWNVSSPAMPDRVLNECLSKIEILLAEIGFTEVKYLP